MEFELGCSSAKSAFHVHITLNPKHTLTILKKGRPALGQVVSSQYSAQALGLSAAPDQGNQLLLVEQ